MYDHQANELMLSTMPVVTIYSDGSFKPVLGTGGYGSIMVCGPFSQFSYGGYFDVSNNAMEIDAALASIRLLNRPCRVTVVSDSRYLCDGINSWVKGWHANGWVKADGRPVQNKELWQEMYNYMQIHLIHAIWTKGHSDGNINNTVADQLACIGAYKEARQTIPPHLLDIRRA